MPVQYVWLTWASAFLIPWLILYWLYPKFRRVMLIASLATMPFGLTEPLFVPEYWLPPSLFDLAARTGFDIESLIFCFAIGGLGVVLYNALTQRRWQSVNPAYRQSSLHRHHRLAIATPFLLFPLLYFFPWNAIYPAIIAMAVGALANIPCRPDLKSKTWIGGLLFLILYTIYIGGLELLLPAYIDKVWNTDNLLGLSAAGIPVEEFLFAFTFGMYWSGVYEHLSWQKDV